MFNCEAPHYAFLLGFVLATVLWVVGYTLWRDFKRARELSEYETSIPCPCGGREIFWFNKEEISYEKFPNGKPRWGSCYTSLCRSCGLKRGGSYYHDPSGPTISKMLSGNNPHEALPSSYSKAIPVVAS